MLFTNSPVNSDDLFICYDECLRQVVDSHVPYETTVKRGRRSERWYTAECKVVKAETRRLERIYRSTHTAATHIQWCQQFNTQHLAFQRVFAEYWRMVIDSCSDTHTLWRRVGGLLHTLSTRVDELSADSFKVFFTGNVDAIRAKTESATSLSIICARSASVGFISGSHL